MKKILFLLGGIVTLTACSEDVYTDVENTEPESMYSTNTFVDGGTFKYYSWFSAKSV